MRNDEEELFSITKLIKNLYPNDKKTIALIFSTLDINEQSSKHIYFDKPVGSVEHKESLLQNIITHLDFEIYKEYIQEDWFKNKDLIKNALANKKFSFVEKAIEFEKNKDKQNYYRADGIIEQIVDFPISYSIDNCGYTTKDSIALFNLWTKALDVLVEQQPKYVFDDIKTPTNIQEKLDYIRVNYLRISFSDLVFRACTEKKMFPFFAAIFQNQNTNEIINLFEEESPLSKSLNAENKKVTNILLKDNLYTQKQLGYIIKNNNEYLFDSLVRQEHLPKTNYINNLLTILDKVEDKKSIPAQDICSFAYLLKNAPNPKELIISFESLKEKFPQLNDDNLLSSDATSANHIKSLNLLLENLKEKHQLSISPSQNRELLNTLRFMNNLVEGLSLNIEGNKKEFSEILINLIDKKNSRSFYTKIFDSLMENTKLNVLQVKSVIQDEVLNLSLDEKAQKDKPKIKL